MITHSPNFFIVTKRISDWYHFCKWNILQLILQVEVSVGTMQMTLYGNYIGDNVCWIHACFEVVLCYWYVGESFCCNYTGDCFCCNYAVRSFCSTYAGTVSAANMWVTIFVVIIQMEVSVSIMQVVFSTVHYASVLLFSQ